MSMFFCSFQLCAVESFEDVVDGGLLDILAVGGAGVVGSVAAEQLVLAEVYVGGELKAGGLRVGE